MIARLAFAWLACALPLLAVAQVSGGGMASTRDYLARMDFDGNGHVSLTEYQDWLSYAFDAMDRDRDGVLASSEQPRGRGVSLTRAVHRERIAERFKRQDANRDGELSAKELASPPQ